MKKRHSLFPSDTFSLVFIFLGGFVLLFVIAPLAGMFINTPFKDLVHTAGERAVQKSIWLTLIAAMGTALLCSIGAIPLAYLLARRDFPLKRLVTGIIDIPVIIPHSAAGIAVLGIISRESLIGSVAGKAGFSFVNHPAGIMTAMAFVSIPFLINAARDGFMAVPERLEKAALSLGASPFRVFFTIALPLAWRSILSGLILMWARGMSEFGAVVIVAYHPMITPVLIYERFGAFGLKYARPAAVLFISICLIVFVILRIIAWEKSDDQN